MRQKRDKPEVGQTLYSLNVRNSARHSPQVLTPVTVLKVGRKYFSTHVGGFQVTTFHLSDWREKTNYTPYSHLYLSPQEWEDEKEWARLLTAIRKALDYGSASVRYLMLGQLRDVAKALDLEV